MPMTDPCSPAVLCGLGSGSRFARAPLVAACSTLHTPEVSSRFRPPAHVRRARLARWVRVIFLIAGVGYAVYRVIAPYLSVR